MVPNADAEREASPDIPVQDWVLHYVEHHAGCTTHELRRALRDQVDEAFREAVEDLLQSGKIEDRADGRRRAYYPPG